VTTPKTKKESICSVSIFGETRPLKNFLQMPYTQNLPKEALVEEQFTRFQKLLFKP